MSAESVKGRLHSPSTAMHRVIVGRDNLGNPDTFSAGYAARPAGATTTRGGGWAWLSEVSSPGSIPGCPQNAWPAETFTPPARVATEPAAGGPRACLSGGGLFNPPVPVLAESVGSFSSRKNGTTDEAPASTRIERILTVAMCADNSNIVDTGTRAAGGNFLWPQAIAWCVKTPVSLRLEIECQPGPAPGRNRRPLRATPCDLATCIVVANTFDGRQPVAARHKGAYKRNARPTVPLPARDRRGAAVVLTAPLHILHGSGGPYPSAFGCTPALIGRIVSISRSWLAAATQQRVIPPAVSTNLIASWVALLTSLNERPDEARRRSAITPAREPSRGPLARTCRPGGPGVNLSASASCSCASPQMHCGTPAGLHARLDKHSPALNLFPAAAVVAAHAMLRVPDTYSQRAAGNTSPMKGPKQRQYRSNSEWTTFHASREGDGKCRADYSNNAACAGASGRKESREVSIRETAHSDLLAAGAIPAPTGRIGTAKGHGCCVVTASTTFAAASSEGGEQMCTPRRGVNRDLLHSFRADAAPSRWSSRPGTTPR